MISPRDGGIGTSDHGGDDGASGAPPKERNPTNPAFSQQIPTCFRGRIPNQLQVVDAPAAAVCSALYTPTHPCPRLVVQPDVERWNMYI